MALCASPLTVGQEWLLADLRLQCYTPQWIAMATYGIIMCVVYIIGLPVTVFVLLYRRRNLLFGNPRDPAVAAVRRKYGFLYLIYGKNA